MGEKLVIYVSGKISAPTPEGMSQNQELGIEKGAELIRRGYAPIIPHANLRTVGNYGDFTYKDLMRVDLAQIRTSDVVYMMSNWKQSRGAKIEERYARLLQKPIIYEETEEVPPLED